MLVADLAGLLKIRAPEAPLFMLERLIRETAREFFRASRTWRMDFGGAIVVGTSTYDLNLPTDALVHDVIYSKLTVANINLIYLRDAAKAYMTPDEQITVVNPKYVTLISNTTFQLIPEPINLDNLDMKIVLTLSRDATVINDEIIEEFEDVLINGGLARLYEQPNKTWSDIRLSQYHLSKFYAGVGGAKLRVEESQTPGVRVASFSW